MPKLIYLVCAALLVSAPLYGKNNSKNTSIEDVIRDGIRDSKDGDDKQTGKGQGRPDNPGEHGRDNAAKKQKESSGKGSKGGDSWEDQIRNAIDDDDKDDKDKNKKKDKDKDKGKGKNKK